MIKIGIELNGIIRDLNKQIVKYYKKDIDKEFDTSKINMNKVDVRYDLPFNSKKKLENYMYVDYSYEIYGCARVMERNIATLINTWLDDLNNSKKYDVDVRFFSALESALTIQSTYFFISKIGTRVRRMVFPKDCKDMWDECDVIITTNKRIVKNKPDGKVVILIKKDDNLELSEKSDFIYDNLSSILTDEELIEKITSKLKNKTSIIKKLKEWLKKFYKKNKK